MITRVPTMPGDRRTEPAVVQHAHDASNSRQKDEPAHSAKRKLTHAFLALADQGFVSLNSFITLILVAKYCGTNAVNLYVLAFGILSVVRVLQERLLAAPYVVFTHQSDRDSTRFLGSSLLQQAIFSVGSLVLFSLLAVGFSHPSAPAGIATCLWVIAIAGPCVLLRDHLRTVSCAHFGYVSAVFLSGGALILQLAAIYIFYQFDRLNAATVFASMGMASFIPALVWWLVRPQPFQIYLPQAKSDWQTTFQYSRWLVAARVFPSVASCLIPFIALWLISEDAAGIFGSCLTLANVSLIFVAGANNFFQPRAVQAFNQSGKRALCRILMESMIFFWAVLSVLCVIYFTLGDQLLAALLNESYRGYGYVVGILGIHALVVAASIVAGNGMAALGKPKGLFAGELAFSVVTIGLAVALCGPLGVAGAAWALVGGSCVATIVAVWFFLYLLRQSDAVCELPQPETSAEAS